MDMLMPVYDRDMSDSANLDMMVELLALSGRPLAHAMMMVMPEAWQSQEDMDVDTVGDVCDNCPDASNNDQANSDSDDFGDVVQFSIGHVANHRHYRITEQLV